MQSVGGTTKFLRISNFRLASVCKLTMAPKIMLKGFQKAACRSPAITAPTPLKMAIQYMYDRASERSLGLFCKV